MPYISETDFSGSDLSETHTLGTKQAVVDNKADWVKMIMTLVKNHDPINQPDFAMTIIEIFYTVIALEANYKIMPAQILT
jgi:hypothetical protein